MPCRGDDGEVAGALKRRQGLAIDLRMRKEGLDLELERHVEARDAGRPTADPYRVPIGATAPAPGATDSPGTGSEPPATWS